MPCGVHYAAGEKVVLRLRKCFAFREAFTSLRMTEL
jgi:hypothetical protein